jgi:hypothetical protein
VVSAVATQSPLDSIQYGRICAMKVDEDEKFPSGAGGGSGGLKALSMTWC